MRRPPVEQLAPWIAGCLLAAPILWFRYPPMGDLGFHEALVALLRHRADPRFAPPGLYTVVAPQANQLFHFLAYALASVVRTDVACRLVVAATVGLAPPLLARTLGRLSLSRWPALLVAPIVCGWLFTWGLVPNLLGVALLLGFLPVAEAVARRTSLRSIGAASAAVTVLFLAHESSALALALVIALFVLVRARRVQDLAARSVPVAVALGLAALQWHVSRGLAGASMRRIGSDFGVDPLERLLLVPGAIFGGNDALRTGVVVAAWATAIVVGAVLRRGRGKRLPGRVVVWRARYALLAAIFFFLFLAFPMTLGGNTLLAHRFLPVACACLVVAAAPRRTSRVHAVLAAAIPLVVVGAQWKNYGDADRRYAALAELLPRIPDGASVAQLDLTASSSGRVAPVPGIASRVQAVHGGRMLFMFVNMPPNPIYTPDTSREWAEPVLRMAHDPFAFVPAHDARRFAYLLTLNRNPALRPFVQRALAPEEELVASSGAWDLYRSTLPVVPVDAPDAPLAIPAPETLADRVNRSMPR